MWSWVEERVLVVRVYLQLDQTGEDAMLHYQEDIPVKC